MPKCRILVIDDHPPTALKVAKQIRDLGRAPSLQSLGVELAVEISNSAFWAWEALEGESERWNIIFSDVMMPVEEEKPSEKRESKDGFTVWLTSSGKGVARFEGGGFYLAQNLLLWRRNSPDFQLPKLVLMSSLLDKPKRMIVNTFARENREWFQYFDKDECPQHWRGDRAYLYRYALLQALINYQAKSWNDGQFYPVTSEWRQLRYDAKQMAKNSRIRHVLVTGPTGSGKSVLARFLLNERGIQDPQIVNAGELDKDGLDKWWRQGGLYIDHLERINPSAHDPVCRELEKTLENPDGEEKLCVWSANSIHDLKKSEVLSDSFINLVQMHSLVIDKLRIEDVQEITGAVLDQYAPEFKMTADVYEALEKTEWPDNLRGVQGAVKEAINRARELGDSELRVDHLQLQNLGTNGQAMPGLIQTPPALLQHEIAAGMTPSVPDMNPVDDWTFRQQKVDAVKKELKKLKAVIDGKAGKMLVSGPEFISSRQSAYPALAQCDQDFVGHAISHFKDRSWRRSLKDLAVYVFSANESTRFEDYEEKYGSKEREPNHGAALRGKRLAPQPSPRGNLRRIATKRGM